MTTIWPEECLLHAAFTADLLVELRSIPFLGGLAALLTSDASDLAVKIGTVLLLGGLTALTAGLGSGHLRLRHSNRPPEAN